MSLFIQGMRRSGTTILHDALLADPELRSFYEPLREQDASVGGGSGAREGDAFAETRALREEFRAERYPEIPIEDFNWGGPRDPALELTDELPPHCADLLIDLLGRAPKVTIKETRLGSKVPALARIAPDAALVHLVRDPRAVATSTMLGRGRHHLERFGSADAFFEERSARKLWSSRAISELLLERPEYAGVEDPPDHLRLLMVWKHGFETTRRDATRLLGDRYLMLRHEELSADPHAALERVYGLLGRPVPDGVAAWAAANVRPPGEIPFGDDEHWARSAALIGLAGAVEDAGYTDLAAG